MYFAFEDDSKLVKQLYEERREQLARTYADGQADAVGVRLMLAKSVGYLGNRLLRASQSLRSSNVEQQRQELQLLRVRMDNGK